MSINIRTQVDLIILIGISAAFPFIEHLAPVAALCVLLGLGIILVVPGYLTVMMLFPGRDDLQAPERVGFIIGLSFAMTPFVGLILDYTPVSITDHSFLFSFSGFSILVGLVALYRRSKLAVEDRFVLRLRVRGIQWHRMDWSDKVALTISTMAVILLGSGVIATVLIPRTGERFTEFYLLKTDGQLGGYLSQVTRGQPIPLILGVVNREHGDTRYRIEREDNKGTEHVASLRLDHEGAWEQPYTFVLEEPGEHHKVTFLLYKGDEQEPYRSLHLWFTVEEQ